MRCDNSRGDKFGVGLDELPECMVSGGKAIDEASKSRFNDILVSATEFYGIQQYIPSSWFLMLNSPLGVVGDYPFPKSCGSFA